jgi:hypothetical protein
MAQIEDPPTTLKDLMSHVGVLLLKWGQVEGRMRSVVGAAKGLTAASRQGQALFEAWGAVALAGAAGDARRRDEVSHVMRELEALRPLRNLVCHGIQSASSVPFGGRPAGLYCWLEDEETVVSWGDLDEAIRRLEGLAEGIR